MIWNNWEDLNGWREWFERSRLCAAEQQTKRHTDPHAEGDFPLYSEQEDETHPAYMPWEAFDLVSTDCHDYAEELGRTEDELGRYQAFVRWMGLENVFALYDAHYDPMDPGMNIVSVTTNVRFRL